MAPRAPSPSRFETGAAISEGTTAAERAVWYAAIRGGGAVVLGEAAPYGVSRRRL